MFGLPLEVFTMLLSTVVTFVASLMALKVKAEQARHDQMIEGLRQQAGMVESARGLQNANARWARRVIVIAAVFSVLLWPMLAPLFDLSVVTGWSTLTGGLWPFTTAKPAMEWHTVSGGIVLTPLHTHLMSAIVGYYFGASAVESVRWR